MILLQQHQQHYHLLQPQQTAAAVVYSAGSSAAVPYQDVAPAVAVVPVSQVDTDSRWDSDARNRQTPDSSAAAAGTAAQAVPEAGIAAGLEEGSAVAAVRAGAHIVVSQAEGRNDVVAGYARPRMVEAGSAAVVVVAVVVVGGRGEMKAVVGRIGRLEGAQSTVVDLVGLEALALGCQSGDIHQHMRQHMNSRG